MADGIQQTGLDYRYQIIDMHTVDCETLLNQGTPEALVFAILCDFKGRPEREVVHYILQRLHQLTAENESRFREYMRMLEVLSTNRALEQLIEEEEKMLSQVEQTRLPSYRIGMQQGEGKLLERQINRRFGIQVMTASLRHKLATARVEELEQWADNILDAKTLDDVFRD
jgi:hypothetical protein